MVVKVKMTIEDEKALRHAYKFEDENETLIAEAMNYWGEEPCLRYYDRDFIFSNRPRILKKCAINVKYPISSKFKKMVGFSVTEGGRDILEYYNETVICGNRRILKKRIVFVVYKYEHMPYILYKVGFKGQASHYYCLYDNNGKTVAIIERNLAGEDNCKATIYVEDNKDVLLALLVCMEAIITKAKPGSNAPDISADRYVSLLEEEMEMFDNVFWERLHK